MFYIILAGEYSSLSLSLSFINRFYFSTAQRSLKITGVQTRQGVVRTEGLSPYDVGRSASRLSFSVGHYAATLRSIDQTVIPVHVDVFRACWTSIEGCNATPRGCVYFFPWIRTVVVNSFEIRESWGEKNREILINVNWTMLFRFVG